jgi:hypothetical protein
MRLHHMLFPSLIAVALVAACNDGPPVAPVRSVHAPAALAGGIPASDERSTITRTVETSTTGDNGRDKPRKVTRRTRTFTRGTGRVTLRAGDVDARSRLRGRGLGTAAPTSMDSLPITDLVVPASDASLYGATLPWRRITPMPGDPETVLESDGVGSAPASTIRMIHGGVTTAVIRQEWSYWQGAWELVRRESVNADSSVRDVIDVRRTGHRGIAVESPAAWSRHMSRGTVALSPSFDLVDYAPECVACAGLQAAFRDQGEILLAATIGMVGACAPTPAAVACLAALTAVWSQTVRYERAQTDLEYCIARHCPPPPPPPTAPLAGTGGTSGSTAVTAPEGYNACTYYFEYDPDTGVIISSELLSCTWVAG